LLSKVQPNYKKYTEQLYPFLLKSCNDYIELNNQKSTQFKHAHYDDIYKIAFDDKLYMDYVNKDVRIVEMLENTGLLVAGGLVVVEESADVELPEHFSYLFQKDRRRYADTGLWIYQYHQKT